MKISTYNEKDLRIFSIDDEIKATYLIKIESFAFDNKLSKRWNVVQFYYDYDNQLISAENVISLNPNLDVQAYYTDVKDMHKAKELVKNFKSNLIFK